MSFILFLRKTLSSFSPLQLCGVFLLISISLIGILTSLYTLHEKTLIQVPGFGGELHEGIIGSPRFINPVLAVSQSDLDLTRLIYSGLMEEGANGEMKTNLADNYTLSEDGLVYTFTLKKGITFHDGQPLTADDVIFTVLLVQDKELQGPHKIEWEGVKAEKIDEKTIKFTLKQPYPAFIHNTTLGILPKHIWKDLQKNYITMSDFNISPIGTGPFTILSIDKTSGIPHTIHLQAFNHFILGRAYITDLFIHIYNSNTEVLQALEKHEISFSAAITPEKAALFKDSTEEIVQTSPLPRIYGVFFNTARTGPLAIAEVRQALSEAIDRNRIISENLSGFAKPAFGPILQNNDTIDTSSADPSLVHAASLLAQNGWERSTSTGILEKTDKKTKKKTELHITLTTTSSVDEFRKTAILLKETWEKLGVHVDIQLYEMSDLTQSIIKKRNYEALLYGTIVQNDADLYAFWHSSQRTNPGLNLSLYANQKVDTTLTTLRTAKNESERLSSYAVFKKEFDHDVPIAFIYSPLYIYITDTTIRGLELANIKHGEDRYRDIQKWFLKTENVWSWIPNIETLKALQRLIH